MGTNLPDSFHHPNTVLVYAPISFQTSSKLVSTSNPTPPWILKGIMSFNYIQILWTAWCQRQCCAPGFLASSQRPCGLSKAQIWSSLSSFSVILCCPMNEVQLHIPPDFQTELILLEYHFPPDFLTLSPMYPSFPQNSLLHFIHTILLHISAHLHMLFLWLECLSFLSLLENSLRCHPKLQRLIHYMALFDYPKRSSSLLLCLPQNFLPNPYLGP